MATIGTARSELLQTVSAWRLSLVGVALFTGLLNLLYLTGSFFMLQIYDRVLPGHSVPTLVGLSILAAMLYGFQGILDVVRGGVLTRIAGGFADALDQRVYGLVARAALRDPALRQFDPARDMDQIRSFMAGGGPAALFDLPWLPLYLGICYVFHPLIGLTATVGALILVAITVLTEIKIRRPTLEASMLLAQRNAIQETSRNNAEVLHAMGMVRRFAAQWADNTERYLKAQQRAADVTGGLGGLSRTFRMLLQSAVLAVGAYLVIEQQATAGVIIAGSILSARALSPAEQVIAQWRVFVAARQSWRRLATLLDRMPEEKPAMPLPPPRQSLVIEGVSIAPPGSNTLTVQDVAFQLRAGQGLGVIGPSASGKSTLVRAIVGVWRPARGKFGSTVPRSTSGRRSRWEST